MIAASSAENASGTHSDRPELLRLLNEARSGDVLLLESIERLSCLSEPEWRSLKAAIDAKRLDLVALDLRISHPGIREVDGDGFTSRILAAFNSMMIEMMAVIARKD